MKSSIGDYEIVREIGSDLLGTLYLARHRYLKRLFALKALPEEFAGDSHFIARFEEEMAHSGRLDHPHIVRMHTATCIEGTFFIISEAHDEGDGQRVDLETLIRTMDLGEDEIFQIAQQIASALDYAHEPSESKPCIAHGGIRLANVLIEKKEERLSVYLDDFGLMRVIGPGAVLSRMYRQLSSTLGERAGYLHKEGKGECYAGGASDAAGIRQLHRTFLQDFAFLAPEQREGGSQGNDPKSDVYAFGVLLYYLLMKKFPEGFFPLPSTYFPSLHYNWDLLLYHCLQHDREKRPASLKQALKDLLKPKTILPSLLHEIQHSKASELKPVLNPAELTRPEFIADPAALFAVDPVVGRYQPRETEISVKEPLLTEMAIIHGGQYWRGSSQGGRDEIPRHLITLSSFAMDTHPVTNEQFVRFLDAMGGEKDGNNNDMIRLRDSRIKRSAGRLNIESGYARHPVVGVSWYGAVAYAKWVGKRLPTEAEWEIASMGGSEENIYPTGKEIERSQANYFSSDTTVVMSYQPNAYGLHDMAGNVYEWCQDWYEFHYYDVSVQEPQDPKGPVQGNYRVLRGGCWKSLKEDLRCAHRHRNNPGTMNGTYGFRCAADVS